VTTGTYKWVPGEELVEVESGSLGILLTSYVVES
jgi:hypothetical protein